MTDLPPQRRRVAVTRLRTIFRRVGYAFLSITLFAGYLHQQYPDRLDMFSVQGWAIATGLLFGYALAYHDELHGGPRV